MKEKPIKIALSPLAAKMTKEAIEERIASFDKADDAMEMLAPDDFDVNDCIGISEEIDASQIISDESEKDHATTLANIREKRAALVEALGILEKVVKD